LSPLLLPALNEPIPELIGTFVTSTLRTPDGVAYDRAGPRGDVPVVLLHAGIADRRMWDPQWSKLTAERDVIRLDLRGFGETTERPAGELSGVDDVLDVMTTTGIEHCHLVGASFGAGVAVEVALSRPELVDSLFLSGPGGALIAGQTPELQAFIEAEESALARNDLAAAVEANLTWWVDGPHRGHDDVHPTVRELVRQMQRQAFEVTADWDDVEDDELDPPALERLSEIRIPTQVLVGALDLDAIKDTARRVADAIPGAQLIEWSDVAHLPSMERPDEFLELLLRWVRP
jgi:pimeloyl-ACP methyl ester carboxylesterase